MVSFPSDIGTTNIGDYRKDDAGLPMAVNQPDERLSESFAPARPSRENPANRNVVVSNPRCTVFQTLANLTPSNSLGYLVNDAVPYAVSNGANIISMSWAAAESAASCSTWQSESSYFSNAASAGAIPVASSGDSGAFDGTSSPTVSYPASDPCVVGVGGTTLAVSSSNSWSSEVVWNDQYGSSGGGVSSCFTEPSYQSSHGIQVTTSGGSSTPAGRSVPDVAYDADVLTGFWVYDTSSFSGWVQVGGTSAGAPQWATVFADALSSGTSVNGGSVHGSLYGLIGTSDFHDITSGNNNYYFATSGYDATTGVGTPVESNLLPGL